VLGALFLTLILNIIPLLAINTAFGVIAGGGLTLVAILLRTGVLASAGLGMRPVSRQTDVRGAAL
jgi:hypothetical protein